MKSLTEFVNESNNKSSDDKIIIDANVIKNLDWIKNDKLRKSIGNMKSITGNDYYEKLLKDGYKTIVSFIILEKFSEPLKELDNLMSKNKKLKTYGAELKTNFDSRINPLPDRGTAIRIPVWVEGWGNTGGAYTENQKELKKIAEELDKKISSQGFRAFSSSGTHPYSDAFEYFIYIITSDLNSLIDQH